jgi:hypothetical protein
MGKGIALQFKQAFPDNHMAYRDACKRGDVKIGEMFVFDSQRLGPRRYVINFHAATADWSGLRSDR